ncbi:hypothetical protein [Mycolicibacterium sp.]|uniref:hypothetical protein n=1 Tax=Mycolicibacterium sp. TaxID=2320850 RepID=UPI001A29AE7F|nr:hypothetical protein [Mycolicibacterium sp.]MBJ7341592.1 hypothetical protein [Mycolicibacterium sp.]
MNSWARWTVRILLLGPGLLVGLLYGALALRAASDLGDAIGAVARRDLLLTMMGNALMAVGFIAICLTLAFRRDWATMGRSFALRTQMPGGRRGIRQARRQIDGRESYREDDVAHLRRYAEYRLKARRSSPATWTTVFGLISFNLGFALTPTASGDGLTWGSQFGPALRILAGVMALVFVAAGVMAWRQRNDVRAEAFLERTREVTWPADDRH